MIVLCISMLFSLSTFVSGSCESRQTCNECIQEFNCEWCITLRNDSESVHCRSKSDSTNWCTEFMDIISNHPEKEERDFTNETEHPIQIRPQRMKITLRKGEKFNFTFQYKITENYPVDLYYLMDLSNSMKAHKNKLSELGAKLAEKMRTLTTNFRLGFGSFIDKVDLPFVSTVQEKLNQPCPKSEKCVPPYSFKHHLNLTKDEREFVNKVRQAQVSGNLDAPEGGLDAMMQAIVCKEKIGWRTGARHLLVFSTDAEFHIAGDGKLAGVVEPNKAICYNSDEEYLIYDYPSVSHINYVAQQHKINIVFAIVNKGKHELSQSYMKLSQAIENSLFGELVESDADNVISLVYENYKKIVQNIKFTSNATREVDIKFFSNDMICDSTGKCTSRCNNDGKCENVRVGEILNFTAMVEVLECSGDNKKMYSIHPEALEQNLIIELDIRCECPCSSETNINANSAVCSNGGNLTCGICECSPGRYGSKCQCDNPYGKSENDTNCIMKGSTEECSGRGSCFCGKCKCNSENLSGQWCECDSNYCMKNDLICSGRGKCECSKCTCQKGWTGKTCDCTESTKECTPPDSNQVCSNNGNCNCGKCTCRNNATMTYAGKYCEDCVSCKGGKRCGEFRDCVECKSYKDAKYDQNCDEICNALGVVTVIQEPELSKDNDRDDIKECEQPDRDKKCKIRFMYYYDENKQVHIKALDKKICPAPPNILAWILGVTGSIVVAGIIMLLVWKICTTVHDRREYAKFEQERKGVRWHANKNPLYKETKTEFINPAYKRASMRNSVQ